MKNQTVKIQTSRFFVLAKGVGETALRRIEKMKRLSSIAALLVSCALFGFAADNPMVGGAPMYASKTIVDNAVHSKDHTTLVAAVKAAGLVNTLEGAGPFTVFAPTNDAFAKLPAGTVDTLLKPENKETLTRVLTYHVLPGRYTASRLKREIANGNGMASIKTVQGDALTFSLRGDDLLIKDEKGGTALITIANVMQSNGVIHVIDTVLQPN